MKKQHFVHSSFEEQVKKSSNLLAVSCGLNSLTYDQLNKKANLLAHYLIQIGVKRNTLVGISISRSIEFIIAILAVLKAGGTYVPIDLCSPAERLKLIINDANLAVIITQTSNLSIFNQEASHIVDIDSLELLISKPCFDNPPLVNTPEDQIYVIYTSGSTGQPKGAINCHQGFFNLVHWYANKFKMSECDNVLIYTTLSFDLTQKNLFAPLLTGAKLYLLEDVPYDPDLITQKIKQYQITWINSTPSAFYPLIEYNNDDLDNLSSLRYVFVGGEPLFAKILLPIKHSNPQLSIINTYGPTECSDVCAFHPMDDVDYTSSSYCVPIGKAIDNMQMFILNDQLNEVLPGEIGELYVTGIGVGLGYLNNRELTEQKFINDPFNDNSRRIFYSTSDLVRYLPNGDIEFIERKDFQVKIRGFRVELGEVESSVKTFSNVKDALVIANEDSKNQKFLVAYIVANKKSWKKSTSSELKEYLKNYIPSYMIPDFVIRIDKFPLTLNGKIDRKKLPLPKVNCLVPIQQLDNKVEEKLVGIWSKLLHTETIDINDNFFVLGGHSLSAIKLISWIRKEFGIELSIKLLFEYPTIHSLAKAINANSLQHRSNILPPKKAKNCLEYYPPSFPHQRILYIEQKFSNRIIFNNMITLEIDGPLNFKKLEQAFQKLINRHDIFKTHILSKDSKTYENVSDNWKFNLNLIDFTSYLGQDLQSKIIEFAEKEENIPFDLTKLPLIRASLLQLDNLKHVLVIIIHQFLIDGWSMDIFYSELAWFYNEEQTENNLPTLPIQYKDYAIWQNSELNNKSLAEQILFWKKELKEAPKIINLQTDKVRPTVFSYNGRVYTKFISLSDLAQIHLYCKTQDTTLFMVLLSAYSVMLCLLSKENDVVIGSPIANRRYIELENLIGFFVNLVPLRIKLDLNSSFTELVNNVKNVTLAAYNNQDLPFLSLMEHIKATQDKSYHPIFQVVFAMQPYGVSSFKLPDLIIKDLDLEEPVAKFDITLNVSEKEQGLELKFEYAQDLYDPQTIIQMAKYYEEILKRVISSSDVAINLLFKQIE